MKMLPSDVDMDDISGIIELTRCAAEELACFTKEVQAIVADDSLKDKESLIANCYNNMTWVAQCAPQA